jgi:hypothetical protein
MKLFEKILLVLCLLSMVMMFSQLPGGSWMFMLAGTLLACIYFPFGFLFFSGVGIRQLFKGGLKNVNRGTAIAGIFTGLGLANICIGIVFRFLHFPGANQMLLIGILSAVIMVVVCGINYAKTHAKEFSLSLSRLVVFIVIGITLLFTSSRTLLNLQYRNHPAYVDAYLEYQHNPTPETEQQRDLEYKRMILSPEEFERYDKGGR